MPPNIQELTQHADSLNVPGLSFCHAIDGQIVDELYLGKIEHKSGPAVDRETIFEAASLTKPVFAYLAVRLHLLGLLDLTAPLIELAGSETSLKVEPHVLQNVNGFMILSHQSGLPRWRFRDPNKLGAEHPIGKFQYSGLGYSLLQKLIEDRMGESLDSLSSTHVFSPLNMTRSSLTWKATFENKFARPHDQQGQSTPFTKWPTARAAYSLYSTATDFIKFINAFIEPSTSEMSSLMLKPQVQIDDSLSWGLGWGLANTKTNNKMFWHWGNNKGSKSFALGIPSEKRSAAAFTNGQSGLHLIKMTLSHFALETEVFEHSLIELQAE